jgi:rhamnosyltransferase subunit B
VALGRALLARGHTVTLITSVHFREVAAQYGISFVGLGTTEDYSRVIEDPDLWDPRLGFRTFARNVVAPAIRPVYEALSNRLRSHTVIVAQGQAFGAHITHEIHRAPFVTVNLQPAAFRTDYDSPLFPPWLPVAGRRLLNRAIDFILLDRELAGPVNSFRAEVGLAPVKHVFRSWAHSPQGTIGLFPAWFAPRQPDWPQNTTLSGFVLLPQDSIPISPDLTKFLDSGSPPIIFTPGTEMKHAHVFFAASLQGLTRLQRRGIFLTRHQDHLPSPLPDGIISIPYVPFAAILPRTAAIVHHGGIGTIAQALASGVPQLVRPMAHDQPDNAARVQRLGVGLTLPPSRYSPDRVHASLQDLITSERVRQACHLYSPKVNTAEALSVICSEIERVAFRYAA